ncbi:solute carrier family 40 member 1-like [Limulus polyphemus]|uniref:Solute carrier family 40 member n=1 Tax=Limulus polyphemus TaxID=6850 RepID=A0ABM1B831_LIMPO|nr:solute carrier family 40 member 1-like [Limulus polyphemus]
MAENEETTPLLETENPADSTFWGKLKTPYFKMYCSHALSAWGDRMWTFAVGLYLVQLYPSSLRVTAIFGLAASLSVIILGSSIGNWVDRNPRLKAARNSLIVQNSMIVLCAVGLCLILLFPDFVKSTWQGWLDVVAQIYVILTAVLAQVASVANTICVEKDWVPVIAGGNNQLLTEMNAMMRRIDLIAKLLAPLLVGQIMTLSSIIAAIFLAGWNFIGVFFEYWLLWRVYKSVPQLAVKAPAEVPATNSVEHQRSGCCSSVKRHFLEFFGGWKIYFSHEVCPAGLGLAFLFMTVLGFDSITIGYCYTQGVSEAVMGGMTGLAGFTGVIGTIAYPAMRKRVGLERTGLFGLFSQICCASLCVISIWLPGSPFDPFFTKNSTTISDNVTEFYGIETSTSYLNSNSVDESATQDDFTTLVETLDISTGYMYTSVIVFLAGMIAARTGLWLLDMTVNQFLQELVEEKERGVVSGVQYSLNMTMDLVKFVLVIAIPWTETFGILIILSFAFTCGAWISYAVFSNRRRGHLLPYGVLKVCNLQTLDSSLDGQKRKAHEEKQEFSYHFNPLHNA